MIRKHPLQLWHGQKYCGRELWKLCTIKYSHEWIFHQPRCIFLKRKTLKKPILWGQIHGWCKSRYSLDCKWSLHTIYTRWEPDFTKQWLEAKWYSWKLQSLGLWNLPQYISIATPPSIVCSQRSECRRNIYFIISNSLKMLFKNSIICTV